MIWTRGFGALSSSEAALVCTTPWKVTAESLEEAKCLCDWFRCRFVERNDRSIAELLHAERADAVVVAESNPRIYTARSPATGLFFHPGMAMQRIDRMRRGEPDRLVRVMGLRPGDTVVDATLGAGSDTLVLAEAVGVTGRVIALETSIRLAGLFDYARQRGFAPYEGLDALAERIAVVPCDHVEWLRRQTSGSVTCVYFDPMFEQGLEASPNMKALRPLAYHAGLQDAAMGEARRVAARCVVVKERPGSATFEHFQMVPDKQRAHIAYGVIHCGSGTWEEDVK